MDRSFDKAYPRWNGYISLSAILAGIIMAISIGALLNLLGLGLGFLTIDIEGDTLYTLTWGAIIWLIINGVISLGIGSWFTGRLAPVTTAVEGLYHGLVTWGAVTILGLLFVTASMSAIISGSVFAVDKAISYISNVMSSNQIKPLMQNAISDDSVGQIKKLSNTINEYAKNKVQAIDNAIATHDNHQTGSSKLNTQSFDNKVISELSEPVAILLVSDRDTEKSMARKKIASILGKNTNLDADEVNEVMAKWNQELDKFKKETKENMQAAIEEIKPIVSGIVLTTFFVLVLGALSAAIGGYFGASRRTRIIL